ncbi:hypothetical protein E1176_06075 [Fulvivirga sp. RKSG066]|uniref:DUF6268 family outer membrane beta-barrel protein n=1 Tax=Fulvivirga aurantia TaxID=2529383 RepID=UPI0012BD4751|nr:DUF6268 family outer membrane beta-barrel protein [Fulvivirga aurantia]MTI20581.1 hypothetical protein [Fulvivirga aurantia]
MRKFALLSFLILVVLPSVAQDSIKWATPNVKYQPLGRGLDISYTRIINSDIESEAEVQRLRDNEATISSLENMEYDIKVPIMIKDRTQILGSFEYTYDYFSFKNPENLNYEFYEQLHHKHLRSRKLKFYMLHSLNSENYINMRVAAALNGDVSDSNDRLYEFAKYSLSFIYGWQKSEMNAYGVGLYFDYTLGQPMILPVFEWNKSWNKTWGFESKLPGKFLVRYTPNDGTRVYGGYNTDGISYRVFAANEETDILDEYEIRRSDVKFMLSLEKRVYDFIWMGLEGGINYNIRIDASDGDKIYDEKELIASNLSPAPYVNVSLFVVPTEGLKEMFGYSK